MAEFVSDLADYVVSGLTNAGRYQSSGISVQVNVRREMEGADAVAVLRQTGGVSFPLVHKEQQGIQLRVDATKVTSGQTVAREIYDLLQDVHAVEIGGHSVLWLRSVSGPPQAIPVGPIGDQNERYSFTVNFEALLVLQ